MRIKCNKYIIPTNITNFTHVVFIPSSVDYYDRLKMFCELGLKFSNQYIYLNSGDIDKSFFKKKYPNTNFIFGREKANIVTKIILLYKFIQKINNNHLIIHDLFIPRLAIIHKVLSLLSSKKKAYYFISLYFPNTKYYKTRGWEKLKYPLTQKEENHYVKMFRMRSFYERISTHIYDGIIGNSSDIIDGIIHWYKFPKYRTAVLPTAIDLSKIEEIKDYNLEKKREIISLLYVGSIQPRKEVELVIESVGIMITKFKIKCRLSIVGGYHTNREKIIKNLILKYGINKDVEFTGHLSFDKLYEYYKKADCFVFPSRWEGSPRAIKEALAFNLPVVAADIPGNRLLDKKGLLIHYVKKQIPNNYSRKIIQALSERRKNTINLMKKFNPTFIAQKNYDFYKKVITNDNQ